VKASFTVKKNLKRSLEQKKINELEKRLKDDEFERNILKKKQLAFFLRTVCDLQLHYK
jgi:hypothetical protein